MQTIEHPINYENAITELVRQLPDDRAAQLYDFARFLLAEVGDKGEFTEEADENLDDLPGDEELAAEDALWEADMARHADRFAALKAQAKADVRAKRTEPYPNRHPRR